MLMIKGGLSRLSEEQEERVKEWIGQTLPRSSQQIGAFIAPVFGAWAERLELTRELAPVPLVQTANGAVLADRGGYVEDAAGGYWQLASGEAVRDARGAVVAVPKGAEWRVEKPGFNPYANLPFDDAEEGRASVADVIAAAACDRLLCGGMMKPLRRFCA